MTDPKRRNTRLTEADPTFTAEFGETTIRAVRTPAAAPRPAETEAVQVRPVRRPAGSVPTTSLEALSSTAGMGRAPRPAEPSASPLPSLLTRPAERRTASGQSQLTGQTQPQGQRPSAPATRPAPTTRPAQATAPTQVIRAAPAETPDTSHTEAGSEAAPRSGWLSHALNDWLQSPAPRTGDSPAPAAPARSLREAAPVTAAPPVAAQAAAPQANLLDAIRAEPPQLPRDIAPQDLPLTLQDALASDLLPDLPVELLERLWQQEQAALAESEAAQQPPVPEAPAPAPQFAAPTPVQRSGVGTASGPLPSPQRPLSAMPEEAHAILPTLQPMFPGVSPFLARFLPLSAPLQMGLNARFCDLHAFLKYLHDLGWYGYLHVAMGDLSTYALVYEGRVVAAAAVNATGEQALGELLALYEQGATMATYPLPPTYAHVLSGVGSRAWKFDLTEDFTGLYADPEGAVFYSRGEVVATMPAGLPYEGAFPAPLRPQTLILPRSFAGWAHQPYVLTLRGRDANNPITSVYHEFRAKYGEAGAQFMRALGQQQTPAEYAVRTDAALHDLETMLQEFTQGGYLKEQG